MTHFLMWLPAIVAGTLFTLAVSGALLLHAVPALLSGLLAFVLTRALLDRLQRYPRPARLLSHEALSALLIGVASLALLFALGSGVAYLLRGETLQGLVLTLAETLDQSKRYLPASLADVLPTSVLELQSLLAATIKEHAKELAGFSTHALHSLVLTLVGWLVGVLAAVRHVPDDGHIPEFLATWRRLWRGLGDAFQRVATAQAKIAALNAALSAIFLLIVAPLVGWHIPYAKTMVLVTFLCGLLPVVGNLISNTLVFVLALGVSLPAAVASLGFLVVAHKVEYFAASAIQGHEIGAQTWELLIMLFAFEMLFGPAGMVVAPVIYAFVKSELRHQRWLPSSEMA